MVGEQHLSIHMAKVPIKFHKSKLQTLVLIYRFRYVNPTLMARLRGISHKTAFLTLESLYQQGILNKKYQKSYKLLGKPGTYSLTMDGVNYLKNYVDVNAKYAHTHYKNTTNSDSYIERSLNAARVSVLISESYPNAFNIFTAAEMTAYSDKFPRPLPNLYLNRTKESDMLPNYYMLDVLTGYNTKVIAGRIDKYIKHFESGDWEEEEHPTILLIVDNAYIEKEAIKAVDQYKDNNYIESDDVVFMVTTIKALLNSNTPNIWTSHNQELASL